MTYGGLEVGFTTKTSKFPHTDIFSLFPTSQGADSYILLPGFDVHLVRYEFWQSVPFQNEQTLVTRLARGNERAKLPLTRIY